MSGLFIGIDIGSRTAEAVIVDGAETVVQTAMVDTAGSTDRTYQDLMSEIPATLLKQTEYSVGTGYGRVGLSDAVDRTLTEITCHTRGARHLFPDVSTIIDVGGQDSKVISVDESDSVRDFLMNDRCAAGTGRFLEVMCDRLDMSVAEFAAMNIEGMSIHTINATCTVFAESEVVSLLADDTPRETVISSIALMSARNIHHMFRKAGGTPPVFMTGGVSKIGPVRDHLRLLLDSDIHVHTLGQYAGALGAALIAVSAGDLYEDD